MRLVADMRMSLSWLSLFAIVLTLAAISFIHQYRFPGGPIFWNLLSADMYSAWLMLGVLLSGHWYGKQYQGDAGWAERLLLSLERRRYAVAFGLWVVLCAGSLWVYRDHPLSMDEYSALFQAKIFAAGALYGQFPPDLFDNLILRSFQYGFLLVNRETGAVLSGYWPGFSLLLAPFVWLGIPWACNPTIVAASFLVIGRITRDLTGSQQTAGWALLFAIASPAFVANGITYYSMPAHLLFNLGFAWLLLAASPLRLFLAGLVGGFALVLHQPFPHAVFALPWIVWLATRRGQGLSNLFFLGLGYMPGVLLLGVGWWLWRQDVLREGVQAAAAMQAVGNAAPALQDRLMGMLKIFFSMLHWPNEQILFARLGGLVKLWLWASPLLLLLAWWGGRQEKHPGIRLMGASALLTFIAYFLIRYDQGHGWGYRYFHSAWGVLPVLGALGVARLSSTEGKKIFGQIALLTMLSLLAANALKFVQMGNFMAEHLAQFPPRIESGKRIVLHNGRGYYARDLIQNEPWLRGNEIVFLTQTRKEEDKIKALFPDYEEVLRNRFGATLLQQGAGEPPFSKDIVN